jgi:hypothetical protein
MKDQRGPIFRALTESARPRRYWRYDHDEREHHEDDHGFLADQPVDENEPLLTPVSVDEFERAWNEAVRRRTDA